MSSRSGWKVSGYSAEVVLGQGANGQVWRGRSLRSGYPVALKRIDCADPARRRSAQAEAALLSALEHPHLVRLHELVPDGDALVLVLDLADGGSLADILARRNRLVPGEVVTALSPIAAALAYAHDEGVTHGDVSPANVLFTGDGVPLLADLGTARLLGDVGPAQATLAYLDPAVAGGGAPGAPSDVFALAGVALHALTGAPPWSAPTAEEIVTLAAAGEIPDLDGRLLGMPAALAAVVRRGLAGEPYSRGTAGEFALDLRHAIQPVPVELAAGRGAVRPAGPPPAPSAAGPPPAPSPAGPPPARHRRPGRESARVIRPPVHAVSGAALEPPREAEWTWDRPGFTRPQVDPGAGGDRDGEEGPDWAALPMTHAVRARARPPLPPPGRRQRWAQATRGWFSRSRRQKCIGVVLIGCALALAGVLWHGRPSPGQRPRPAALDAASTSPAIPATSAAAAPSTGPVSSNAGPGPSASSTIGWAAVLARLDEHRVRAFATGDADLLGEVYLPGPLLKQDAAAMGRSVAAGCRVQGLRTSYAGVVVVARPASGVTVRTVASLARATVTCAGAAATYTPARPPTSLTIALVAVGQEYRIASLRIG